MKRGILLLLLVAGIGIVIGIGIGSPSTIVSENWNVKAGGENPDMSIQGEGFYPGIITINENDTITWMLGGHLVHTITFLSGGQSLSPDDPNATVPMGGSTYNGTGIVSSGLLEPGNNYSLTFTKSGIYNYICQIHPGMSGLVIVQPSNSTLPFNQNQYITQGNQELVSDINLAKSYVSNLSISETPGPNGTTIFHAFADIPLTENQSLKLNPRNNFTATGNATLKFIDVGKLQVILNVSGLIPNSTHPAHIHNGTTSNGGSILYPLNDVIADANGTGTSTTNITGVPWFEIASRGWFINVHQGPTMEGNGSIPIASGDIIKRLATVSRFTPTNLTINVGDQVEWSQLNFIEIHTITFPGNEPIPEFPSPQAFIPVGGNIHNGTGFYNSGILHVGDKYNLTFTMPGIYKYVCLIHDNIGMIGNITVVSNKPMITNFSVIPDTAISSDNPALATANIAIGISNISLVEFGIIDTNNLLGIKGNGSAILSFDRNLSGVEGLYTSNIWSGNFATIGNIAISEPISAYKTSDSPGFYLVRGLFNNKTVENMDALLWFNNMSLNLSKITSSSGKILKIDDGNTTFVGEVFKYVNGNFSGPKITENETINLYNINGNLSNNNPVLMFDNAPKGDYMAYVLVTDIKGNSSSLLHSIDNIVATPSPTSPPSGGGGGGGGTSSGGGGTSSGGGGTNPQGNGTYFINATATPTPMQTGTPSISVTTTPVETETILPITTSRPTAAPTKAPGFETILAIGAIWLIYNIKKKR